MTTDEGEGAAGPSSLEKRPLSLGEYKRYGRQMILPDFGLGGQLRLKQAKVLIVGAGGLGCPALQYLAAAGVGHITIVDADVVETSNLARQILHTDSRVGMPKAQSAATAARQLNPHIDIVPLCESLSAENAQALVGAHDVVLDCTDNVLTRYLISDAAVLCGKQVVSGAAQGFSGQLVVLHKKLSRESREPIARGPCYRCLYPRAPRPEDVTDCEDGGVLGGVTGLVGTMQALETVKLLARIGDAAEEDEFDTDARNAIDAAPLYMTLINPLDPVPYRSVKLRPRRAATCRSCGDGDLLLAAGLSRIRDLQSEDYVSFCGLAKPSPGGQFEDQEAHISVQTLHESWQKDGATHAIVDVRPPVEFEIASLPGSHSVPYQNLRRNAPLALEKLRDSLPETTTHVALLCRRGNDSLLAQRLLSSASSEQEERQDQQQSHKDTPSSRSPIVFKNVRGGLRAWSSDVDVAFPTY